VVILSSGHHGQPSLFHLRSPMKTYYLTAAVLQLTLSTSMALDMSEQMEQDVMASMTDNFKSSWASFHEQRTPGPSSRSLATAAAAVDDDDEEDAMSIASDNAVTPDKPWEKMSDVERAHAMIQKDKEWAPTLQDRRKEYEESVGEAVDIEALKAMLAEKYSKSSSGVQRGRSNNGQINSGIANSRLPTNEEGSLNSFETQSQGRTGESMTSSHDIDGTGDASRLRDRDTVVSTEERLQPDNDSSAKPKAKPKTQLQNRLRGILPGKRNKNSPTK
jgi:hypothetical protein